MSLANLVRDLLGCEWGRALWTPDDVDPCEARAERVIHLYNPYHVPDQPDECIVKLCPWHATRVCEEESTPHAQ